MKVYKEKRLAQMFALLAGFVVLVFTVILFVDYLRMASQAPLDKAAVESMEEAVKTDAGASVQLTAERERQTQQSLKRDSRNSVYGYLLLAGVVMFLISMNWLKRFEVDSMLPLETLLRLQQKSSSGLKIAAAQPRTGDGASSPEIDLTFVDHIVSKEGRGSSAAVPILRAIQMHYGYLPDEALRKVCEETEITPAQIAGTSSFYAQFRLSPVGRHLVKLCHGTACHVSGIDQITDELRRYLSIEPGEDTDPSRLFTLEKVACLGCCSLAPVMMIDEETAGRLTPASACHALQSFESKRSL